MLNEKEKDDLLECMSLRDEGNHHEIDIKSILVDLKSSKDINNVYNKIDLEKREDAIELANLNQKMLPISEENFMKEISENMKLFKELLKEIKK